MSNDLQSTKAKAVKGGKAYAWLSVFTQVVSWVFTFAVIRLLDPEDYGLMAMAAFITSFVHVFSHLGLGAAVVQRKNVSQYELSSLFWFSVAFGSVMSVVAYFLAYPNAMIFENEELIPITQLASSLFIISSIATIPQNILSRNFEFKKIALVNLFAAFISSVFSVVLAYQGYGVYTLILSAILLQLVRSFGMLLIADWKPNARLKFSEIVTFLKFGVVLSIADGFARFLEAMDKLIIGKFYNEHLLGLYSTAMSLSSMPIDKLSPLINPIVYPLFSRWQDDREECENAYLGVLTYYLMVIAPVYLGGIVVAESLIGVVLGDKWMGIVVFFKAFCIVQLVKVFSSYHKVLMTAQGQANKILMYDVVIALLLIVSIYGAARISFESVIYAWLFVFPVVTLVWVIGSYKMLGLKLSQYALSVVRGIAGAVVMAVALSGLKYVLTMFNLNIAPFSIAYLAAQLLFGVAVYCGFIWLFQRDLMKKAVSTLKGR